MPLRDRPINSLSEASPNEGVFGNDVLEYALKTSLVGFWAWDIEKDALFRSKRVDEIFMSDINVMMDKISDFQSRLHPDSADNIETDIKLCLDQTLLFDKEYRLRRDDGTYIWVGFRAQGIWDEKSGKALRIAGSIFDITDQVKLRESYKAREDELRLIFDNVPAKIWYKDAHNNILRLNKRAADSMNLEVTDAEGASTYDLFPEMAKKYHEDDLRVINSGEPIVGMIEEYTPKDGNKGWVQTDKIPYTSPDTGESYLFVSSIDVTKQKLAEEVIKKSEERLSKNVVSLKKTQRNLETHMRQLEQANKELDHFAYVASHDLKAPLRGMDNIAMWIEEDLGDNLTPDIKAKIDLMRGRISRLETLLKDILAFSRAGRHLSQPKLLSASALIDDVISWIDVPEKYIITKETSFPEIETVRTVFEHIFLNLISNAIKHNDREEGEIILSCTDDGTHYTFKAKDDGPGIPPQYHEHVFQIFKKLQSRDEVEGSGIGLSIVKKMVESIGGKIWIESTPEQRGTTFFFTAPKNNTSEI